jgi:hypothetical protein
MLIVITPRRQTRCRTCVTAPALAKSGGRGQGEGQGPHEDRRRRQHAGAAGESMNPGPAAACDTSAVVLEGYNYVSVTALPWPKSTCCAQAPPTPEVDPANAEFVIFVRSTKVSGTMTPWRAVPHQSLRRSRPEPQSMTGIACWCCRIKCLLGPGAMLWYWKSSPVTNRDSTVLSGCAAAAVVSAQRGERRSGGEFVDSVHGLAVGPEDVRQHTCPQHRNSDLPGQYCVSSAVLIIISMSSMQFLTEQPMLYGVDWLCRRLCRTEPRWSDRSGKTYRHSRTRQSSNSGSRSGTELVPCC